MTAWALGSSMAALAGIFLAEELSALDAPTLTLFIVDAFAAGIIARLKSLPMAYVDGLIIGLSLAFQQNFLVWTGRWTSVPAAIPAVVLFIAVLFLRNGRIEGRPKPRQTAERVPTICSALIGFAVLIAAAFICAALYGDTNGNVLDLRLAAGFAVPIGMLMAGPAVRLQGIYLALATMAFARMAEFLFFDQPKVFGNGDRTVPALSLFGVHVSNPFKFMGISFVQDAGYLIFVTVVFCIVGMIVVLVRRKSFGRRLIAMRDSPFASSTLGMDLTHTKLGVFVFSAAIAGLSGGMFAIYYGSAGTQDFQLTAGLPYLLLLVVGGIATVGGAVFGGLALVSFSWLTAAFPGNRGLDWFQKLRPGLAGIGIGQHPEGAWEANITFFERLRDRIRGGRPRSSPQPGRPWCGIWLACLRLRLARSRSGPPWSCVTSSSASESPGPPQCRHRAGRRTDHWPHRTERRRHDDAVQRGNRSAGAEPGADLHRRN